jgi:glycosyltransferase involved in cell wall biosynthesis
MALKLKKSAGVRVTRFVHGKISAGNAAKLRGDNPAAIAAYRAALDQDPSLAHIWVQIGHVLKDAGQLDEAAVAYQGAVDQDGRHRADALVHLAHLEKNRGRLVHAARHFVQALELDPSATAPRQALEQILSFVRTGGEVPLGEMRWALTGPSSGGGRARRAGVSALILDCTALVHALRGSARSDDAIRRQIGLVDAALAVMPDRVRLAHVHSDTGVWIELSDEDHAGIRMALAAGSGGLEQESVRLANRILLTSAMRDPLEFPQDSWIIGLGSPADGTDHLLPFVAARNRNGARYAAVVDDLLPLKLPQFSSQDRRATTALWLLGLFGAADVIFAASGEIAKDLVRIADEAGLASPESRIVVVPPSPPQALVETVPGGGAIAKTPYALVVGDLDDAKGHLTVLDAWLALDGKRGADLPDLVLMGSIRAHENSAILRRIRANPVLLRKVRFTEDVESEARGALYSGAAMVLCPSFYEGSDAILSDARAYGVPIIASDLPVLRAGEAGGAGNALYVSPGDGQGVADAVEQVLRGGGSSRRRPAAGAARPSDGFEAMVAVLDHRAGAVASPLLQQAIPGRWHPFTPLTDGEIKPGFGTGANFRSDIGWLPPVATGCWTRPDGGEIAIGLPSDGLWRLSLQLMGLATRGSRWTLDIEGRETITGSLDANARSWVVIDDLLAPGGVVRLFLKGLTSDVIDLTDRQGRQRRIVGSLGLTGFHICRQDDWKARETFLETVTLSDLSLLGAYT